MRLPGHAGPEHGLALVSLWSPWYSCSTQVTKNPADHLHPHFGSIWKDFSESCCNQGPWKSGADTSVRKTALKTLVHLAVSNLEADVSTDCLYVHLICGSAHSNLAQWEIPITSAGNQSEPEEPPYGVNRVCWEVWGEHPLQAVPTDGAGSYWVTAGERGVLLTDSLWTAFLKRPVSQFFKKPKLKKKKTKKNKIIFWYTSICVP